MLHPAQTAYHVAGTNRELFIALVTCTDVGVKVSMNGISAFSAAGLHPADILLLWAAKENDTPKTAELLRAGADASVKVRVQRQPRVAILKCALAGLAGGRVLQECGPARPLVGHAQLPHLLRL